MLLQKFLAIYTLFLLVSYRPTSSSRVLIVLDCFSSHLPPILGIIEELIYRNHTITMATLRGCQPMLDPYSKYITYVNIREITMNEVKSMLIEYVGQGRGSTIDFYDNYMVASFLNKTDELYDIEKLLSTEKFDILFASLFSTSAILAAEKARLPTVIPLISFTYAFSPIASARFYFSKFFIHDTLIANYFIYPINWHCILPVFISKFDNILESVRAQAGLDPIYPYSCLMHLMYTHHKLLLSVQSLSFSSETFHGLHVVGPALTRNRIIKPIPIAINEFITNSAKPVIYIAFGSVLILPVNDILRIFHSIDRQNTFSVIWSLPLAQQKLLMKAEHYSNLPSFLKNIDDKIILVDYAPQWELLLNDKVKLFVTHGGYSSILESILARKPMLVFSFYGDQHLNGDIVKTLGCGNSISYPDDFSKLNSTITFMLDNLNLYESCLNRIRQDLSSLNGPVLAVDVIEDIIKNGYNDSELMNDANILPNKRYAYFYICTFLIAIIIVCIIIIFRCCIFCRTSNQKLSVKKKD